MSLESEHGLALSAQVNEVFRSTFGASRRGRIQLAAYAIGDQVGLLKGLTESRNADLLTTAQHIADSIGTVIEDDEFTDIQKAIMARDAALDGARALYGLTERQSRKALRLAETTFYLFNTADPNK